MNLNSLETREDILQKGIDKLSGKSNLSWGEIGKKYNLSEDATRSLFNREFKKLNYSKKDIISGDVKIDTTVFIPRKEEKMLSKTKMEYQENKSEGIANISGVVKSSTGNKQKILDDFLKEHKVDLTTWKVNRYTLNAWDVTMSGSSSSTEQDVTYTNYQIKVWLELKKKNEVDLEVVREEIIKSISKDYSVKVSNIKYKKLSNKEKNLFVPVLFDVHLGKLAWREESGHDYDVKITQQLYTDALFSLIEKVKHIKIDKVLFIIGQDFLNYDYAEPFPQTTAGTPQESDCRWQKMFWIGRNMLFTAIDTIYKEVAPVHVMNIPGNHEIQSMFFLGETIQAKYANNKNIVVDNSPKHRKYFQYGNNLIMSCHGRNEKPALIHNLITTDVPDMWSKTKFRYAYLGHTHHEKELRSKTEKPLSFGEDYKGVLIDYVPSVCQTDKFEDSRGYVGSIRGARAMVHNFEEGRTYKIGHNI